MRKKILIPALFALTLPGWAQEKTLPYTQEDRDRLMRAENKTDNLKEGLTEIKQEISRSYSEIKQEISKSDDDLKGQLNMLFTASIGITFVLLSALLWDRRSAIAPQTGGNQIP
jgi:hypothetical protein